MATATNLREKDSISYNVIPSESVEDLLKDALIPQSPLNMTNLNSKNLPRSKTQPHIKKHIGHLKINKDIVITLIKMLNNKTLPPQLKLLSLPTQSVSGSNVVLYTKKSSNGKDKQYVVKITNYHYKYGLEHVITECKIYNYLSQLVYFNVCDNIILSYDSALYSKETYFENTKKFLMFNETHDKGGTIINLYNFIIMISDNIKERSRKCYTDKQLEDILCKVIPSLLFQLIYTLECLYRAKCKHNDLHTGNVLIFIESTNIINAPHAFTDDKLKYNKYIVNARSKFNFLGPNHFRNDEKISRLAQFPDKEFFVPNYGFTLKVYDFDNSVLFNENNKPVVFNTKRYIANYDADRKYKDYKFMFGIPIVNTVPNEYVDLIKILYNTIGLIDKYIFNVFNKIHKYDNNKQHIIIYNNFKKYFINDIKINEVTNNIYINVDKYNLFYENNPNIYEILFTQFDNDKQFFDFTNTILDDSKIEYIYDIKNIELMWKSYNFTKDHSPVKVQHESLLKMIKQKVLGSNNNTNRRSLSKVSRKSTRKTKKIQAQNPLLIDIIPYKFNDKLIKLKNLLIVNDTLMQSLLASSEFNIPSNSNTSSSNNNNLNLK